MLRLGMRSLAASANGVPSLTEAHARAPCGALDADLRPSSATFLRSKLDVRACPRHISWMRAHDMYFLPRSAVPFGRALLTLGLACAAPIDARAQADTATPAEVAPDTPARVQFRVVVNAPRPYEKLLETGLDLTRWQRDRGIGMPLLERLVA